MLEQGPDFWRWFDTTRFSYHCIHPIHAKVFSIQVLLYTFQSNCAEGLHFSAHNYMVSIQTIYSKTIDSRVNSTIYGKTNLYNYTPVILQCCINHFVVW